LAVSQIRPRFTHDAGGTHLHLSRFGKPPPNIKDHKGIFDEPSTTLARFDKPATSGSFREFTTLIDYDHLD